MEHDLVRACGVDRPRAVGHDPERCVRGVDKAALVQERKRRRAKVHLRHVEQVVRFQESRAVRCKIIVAIELCPDLVRV